MRLSGVRSMYAKLRGRAQRGGYPEVQAVVPGENDGLRKENDPLRVFAAPAIPVRRHMYPNYAATDES
jgi:hypothetical protein